MEAVNGMVGNYSTLFDAGLALKRDGIHRQLAYHSSFFQFLGRSRSRSRPLACRSH
jgi:hypothetical protein